jgi:hypothetical protein
MKPIKFKYIFSNGKEFKNIILTLKEIENGQLKAFTNNIPCSFKLVKVCQFINRFDEDNNELCTFDLVLVKDKKSIFFDDIAKVVYIDSSFVLQSVDFEDERWEYFNRDILRNKYKRLGNIYENKELLEESKCQHQ